MSFHVVSKRIRRTIKVLSIQSGMFLYNDVISSIVYDLIMITSRLIVIPVFFGGLSLTLWVGICPRDENLAATQSKVKLYINSNFLHKITFISLSTENFLRLGLLFP